MTHPMRPAEMLVGLELAEGWRVVERLPEIVGRTQSTFSVGYSVVHEEGDVAFCKALDYSEAFEAADPAEEIQRLSAAYLFEKSLLERCRVNNMNRIVHAITNGSVRVPGASPPTVNYLIFEMAEGDGRDVVVLADDLTMRDYSVACEFVKDCGVALGQMHRAGMSHQDVKPSNLLVWARGGKWSSKLADLGRSFCEALESPHGADQCPGDTGWAPPELLYGGRGQTRTLEDRHKADLYSLGSMFCFALTGLSYGAILGPLLSPELRWSACDSGYDEARSFLQEAHERATDRLATMLPAAMRDETTALVADMCHPLVEQRGALAQRGGRRSAYLLERYVSRLDHMTKVSSVRANIEVRT